MSPRQWLTIFICVLINILDGYEILATGFTGPAIASDVGLDIKQLGFFLSAGPTGMILGSLLVAPLGDVLGRRKLIVGSLVASTTGMLLLLVSTAFPALLVSRIVTGIGVGAAMIAANTVAAEASSRKRRDLAVVLQATGFPLGGGGAICGLVASRSEGSSWQSVYAIGGGFAVFLLIPLVVAILPESLPSLVRGNGGRETLSAGHPISPSDASPAQAVMLRLLGDAASIAICVSFFLMMFSFYFLVSWAPRLLTANGSANFGVSGTALISVGGVIGDLVFAFLALRWRAVSLVPVFASLCFASAIAITLLVVGTGVQPIAATVLGLFLYGTMAAHYALLPTIFPASLRASGSGLAIGIGRMGAALGPVAGAYLLGTGINVAISTAMMTLPVCICALLLRFAAGRRTHPCLPDAAVQTRSSSTAIPCPTPTHMKARA